MDMNYCKDCAHYVSMFNRCEALGSAPEEFDPITGKSHVKFFVLPSIYDMRKDGGLCGPDAKLFKDTTLLTLGVSVLVLVAVVVFAVLNFVFLKVNGLI